MPIEMCQFDVMPVQFPSTVKLDIIGKDLFGEIGELKRFAKFSCHLMKIISSSPTLFLIMSQIKIFAKL